MNETISLCPVILAGGGGTRLWPLSREHYPKQFLRVLGQHSLLQQTLLRLDGLQSRIKLAPPLLVCNENHRFLVNEQLEEIDIQPSAIMLEPIGRNTAPALTVSALHQVDKAGDAVLMMLPADHYLKDNKQFQQTIIAGYHMALQEYLITFGITPAYAETGYGYIQTGEKITTDNDHDVFKIKAFREKPDADTAEQYLAQGGYLWNSGIFMMKASVWLNAIKTFQPDIYASCEQAWQQGTTDNLFFRLGKEAFENCRSDSIDYAVMEKAGEGKFQSAVIPCSAGWSDVGAWSSLWELQDKDNHNNVVTGDVIAHESNDCLITSEHRLVVAVGCENQVIVETADAVIVANQDKSQDVKQIVDKLKQDKREERLTHRRVYRPWGSYETVDAGPQFQVKRITVKPGKKLSLQMHHKRAEHWVVVNGTATVTCGDKVFDLKQNESTFIPLGEKHRLENRTEKPLEIIEVQSGSYLGEDDIVRFDDDFGRV